MPPHRPRASLARSTLIKMGVRIAVLIALTTFFSYLHIFNSFRAEALARMERYVSERGHQEQSLFMQAEDNHAILEKALQERLRAWRQLDPRPRFDSLFVSWPDETIRNRPQGFDGTNMPGVFIPDGVTVDDGFRRQLLAAYDVVAQYGPVFHARYTNTYVALSEGALVLYWPEQPTWCLDIAPPIFKSTDFDFFNVSTPERNPQRKSVWTTVWVEPVALSLSTPVDQEGRHVATLGHDILIEELRARTLNDGLAGAYNLLFRDDGQLIAHPELRMKIGKEAYNILNDPRPPEDVFEQPGTAEERAHLRAIFERVKNHPPDQNVLELPEYGEYIAVAWLKGPDWNLVTVLPERVVTSAAFDVARYVLVFGLASLLVELLIMYWVLRQQLTRPLQAFTQATDQVAAGDFHVSFKNPRDDELGRLAHGFELMAQEVQRREAALRQANEGLESRIQERTVELREKNLELEGALARLNEAQELLVQNEKLASLGALVAGIAHEIKNPLNFVNNFAQLTVGLVEELREELEAQRAGQDGSPSNRVGELLDWLEQNVRKIDEHGRRADSIVRNMQMHSRAGERTPTDLNALLGEHLELASGGMRATHPGVEVALRKDLDPAVGKVDLVPQDFGRAILNLLDNSLYAVAEKKKSAGEGFTPEVTVSSRSTGTQVEIRIRDNGTGIPRKIQDKLFNPFFTTKPAGSGAGLGLSITYDIVVRQHRGELRLQSTEGESTECLIVLPQPRVRP